MSSNLGIGNQFFKHSRLYDKLENTIFVKCRHFTNLGRLPRFLLLPEIEG